MTLRPQFADLSSNNAGPFDAHAYAAWGAVLLGNKATEGTGYVNPDWQERTQAAHQAGTSVLHYHMAKPGPAKEQADYLLNTIEPFYHEIYDFVCLDIEGYSELADPVPFLHDFNKQCRKRNHTGLVLYSNEAMFAEQGPDFSTGRDWVADYGALPVGFWSGDNLFGHQETESATVPGCPGKVDRSTLSPKWFEYFKLHRPPVK